MIFAQADDAFRTDRDSFPLRLAKTHRAAGCAIPLFVGCSRGAIETLCAGVVILTLLGPAHAEEAPAPDGVLSPPAAETPAPTPAAVDPVTIDPFIELRGSVWRTKAGIVFLKTPVGLLTLTSKTTLKDLKASEEVRFWVHERHSIVEIRKRADGSLVHRYLSGPMTSGTDAPKTLRWWGPDGDQTVHVGAQEARLSNYREGDPLTVEVDETNTISGVHDLQFDLQVSQTPPAGADVKILLSGTVSKLKSNFIFVQHPHRSGHAQFEDRGSTCQGGTTVDVAYRPRACDRHAPHPLRHQLPDAVPLRTRNRKPSHLKVRRSVLSIKAVLRSIRS